MRITILAAAIGLIGTSAYGSVVLQDTFTQNPGNLAGRPVETPQTPGDTWNINNSTGANLQVGSGKLSIVNAGSSGFAKAIAPFLSAPLTSPYELSFTLGFLGNSGNQFYGGFGNAADNGAGFSDYTGGPMFDFNGSSGGEVTLDAGSGPSDSSGASIQVSQTSTVALAILVNPANTPDNVEFLVNNTPLGYITYNGNIGGLWFKIDSAPVGDGVTLSNLQVTETPEPASIGLISLGALGLLRRRRAQ